MEGALHIRRMRKDDDNLKAIKPSKSGSNEQNVKPPLHENPGVPRPTTSPKSADGGSSKLRSKRTVLYPFMALAFCCTLVTKQILESVQMPDAFSHELSSRLVSIIPDDLVLQSNSPALSNATSNLWDESPVIPMWMKDYFVWHREQLADHLHEQSWETNRYLVIRCLESDKVCGGASDRLQSVPKFIQLANASRRLLFIKWTKPAALEEFLVPPGEYWFVVSRLREVVLCF